MPLPDLPAGSIVAVDTETSGLFVDDGARLSVVSAAWRDPDTGEVEARAWPFDQGPVAGKHGREHIVGRRRVYDPLPVSVPNGHSWAPNLSGARFHELLDWLANKRLEFHHAKFDLHMLRVGTRHTAGRDLIDQFWWDTQLVQGLLDPLFTSALKPSAKRYLGDNSDAEQIAIKEALRHNGVGLTKRYDLLPWPIIEPYATKDAELTLRLGEVQRDRLQEGDGPPGWSRLIELEFAMARLLYALEIRGIEFAADEAEESARILEHGLNQLVAELPFKATPAAARAWFGIESAADAVIRDLVAISGNPAVVEAARTYQRVTGLQSALGKWYHGWPRMTGEDGRLRTSFRQGRIESDRPGGRTGGAISGRLSVERVQLQAIPHDYQCPPGVPPIRRFFRAAPGKALYEIDVSQAEVRVATSLCHCQGMLDVLTAPGADVHGATATQVFGVKPGDPDWDQLRTVAKRLTFGILYGAGVRTLRAQIALFTGVDYSEAETRQLIDQYDDAFPELRQASRRAQRKADKGMGGVGYVELRVSGRRRYFGYGERTHKAWNAVIQGTVAELMKFWMLDTEQAVPGAMLLQIHDSMVLELPESTALESLAVVQARGMTMFTDRLTRIGGASVPFVAEYKRWS